MSVTLNTTHGALKIELNCLQTPRTSLCASGYYDGCKFHRNIKDFAIQTGDPTNTGKNGESIYGEFFDDEIHPDLKHDRRGIVSMAHKGQPNTNGSQFFITYSRQPHLNGSYTVYGKVIDGWDTLERMEKEPVGKKHRPIKDIIIKSIKIHSNPIAEMETD